jgi:aspartate racemase
VARILGVLGGMGPLATADFLAKIVAATAAQRDQDNIPLVAWSVPQIPDRVAAILGDGPSPLPAMLAGVAALKCAGAQALAIACNTAHYWHDELEAQGGLPILHIADAAAAAVRQRAPNARVMGLLATNGTIAAGFYQKRLDGVGGGIVLPTASDQVLLGQAIEKVKSGDIAGAAAIAEPVARHVLYSGADQLIVGCSELPIALARSKADIRSHLIDATAALAAACVEWSRAQG